MLVSLVRRGVQPRLTVPVCFNSTLNRTWSPQDRNKKQWRRQEVAYNDSNRRNGRENTGGWNNGSSGRSARSGGFDSRRPNRRYGSRDNEDMALIQRNASKRSKGDGLMGLTDYEVDRSTLDKLEWTDLIPEGEATEAKSGMSPVPTQRLADLKLLSLPLVNSLIHNRKYESLTPVQAQTLIPILKNESVVVRAKTGTGKTAAFSIPTIQKVIEAHKAGVNEDKVKAVIISPTRELAQQIADEVSKIVNFGGLDHIKVQTFVGGLSKQAQLRAGGFLGGRPCDILVATPGRLLDIMDDEAVMSKLDNLVFKVFDEADRLLDIGFERMLAEVRDRLAEVTSSDHEVPLLLFSATADRNVRRFAADEFGSRVKIVDTIPKDEPTANELVDQSAVLCPSWLEVYEGATRQIVNDFNAAKEQGGHFKAIVFMPTVAMVDNYERILRKSFPRGSPILRHIMAIHGQKTQGARQKRADTFRTEKDAILITTDVVARGMDFPLVTHVFQLGSPTDVPSYVHRIGRTARIGNKGKSALYLVNDVRNYLESLARENIRPAMVPYSEDQEFSSQFSEIVNSSIQDEDEPANIINSLMSYMTVLKSKYPINAGAFLRDMVPFAKLYGLETLPLSGANRSAWSDRPSRPQWSNKGRGGYNRGGSRSNNFRSGSSRQNRMRW